MLTLTCMTYSGCVVCSGTGKTTCLVFRMWAQYMAYVERSDGMQPRQFFISESLDKLPPDLGLFDGPKPTIMEVNSTEDLVLMLDGSKRETSRIEFGAHQVVIVRNEEAKQSLPDSFGIDKD